MMVPLHCAVLAPPSSDSSSMPRCPLGVAAGSKNFATTCSCSTSGASIGMSAGLGSTSRSFCTVLAPIWLLVGNTTSNCKKRLPFRKPPLFFTGMPSFSITIRSPGFTTTLASPFTRSVLPER
eukprot:Mycagemm_TRINITY_DN10251_c0_g2::TRINITY_DN10251_c0_g2_i1::g.4327::m.4327 type:complete len:123 gc:universal TRINITY_DN10251_c0_g2_i1:626-258(-)